MEQDTRFGISGFERFLTVWVALCIILGVLIGRYVPVIPAILNRLTLAHISIPITVLIWLMIYPMMLKVDFSSMYHRIQQPEGLIITLLVNWLIKPFSMYLIAALFFKQIFSAVIPESLGIQYTAGAVLLGAAPCTAMVFVWSHLTKGDPAYTVIQVAVNDLVILVAFTPIVALLLGLNDLTVPYSTLFLSIVLFVVLPLGFGIVSRVVIVKTHGADYFDNIFVKKFDNITITGLLLTLIIIFSFQGETIVNNPFHIILIAIPLVLQTFLIFFIGYGISWLRGLPHAIAAPAGMIGASNFFELAVAVSISVFGISSGATLTSVVGVLVEVSVMLTLVSIAIRTRDRFPNGL